MRELQGLCDPTHTQIAHTFVRCSRIRKRKPTKEHRQDFLVEPRVDISPRCFPQRRTRHKPGSPTSHGSTYIEIHISPPCSNPRSAPPPRRGVFCCGGFAEPNTRPENSLKSLVLLGVSASISTALMRHTERALGERDEAQRQAAADRRRALEIENQADVEKRELREQ